MNNTSLLRLPEAAIDHIFDFLDRKAQGRLETTCSFFKNFLVSKLAKFILENYKVLASSSTLPDLKKILLAPVRFIMLAENHSDDGNRWLNSKLIESIWNKNSSLFVEGENSTLELWKKEGTGQLKYLKNEIAKTAKNWDDMDDALLEVLFQVTEFSRLLVRLSKECFTLFSDLNNWTYEHLQSFVSHYFDKDMQEKIYQENPEIEQLKSKANVDCAHEKRNVMRKILDMTLSVFTNKANGYMNKIASFDTIRNASLKNKSHETLIKNGKSGIFVAGSTHVHQILAEIMNFCSLNSLPFLILNPKENLDVKKKSVDSEKYQSADHEWLKRNQELAKFEVLFSQGNKFTADEIENSIDLKYLKDLVINTDIQKIGESDENHFIIWIQICLCLLTFDSLKLEKESISLKR